MADAPSPMNCPLCGAAMSGDSHDRVCPRCALAQALRHTDPTAPGVTALDGYERLYELGRGAMGVVWLARERALDRLVALKVIAGTDDPVLAQRLLREGQAVARLSHPNIIAIHALGGSGADTFLAMDFATGGNLAARLDGNPLDAQSAATLLAKLAGAVAHAHAAGIVHRDLKPSNVLLAASGEPQLADFGLAGAIEGRGELTRTGQVVGTPAYLAPELLGSHAAASPAADVYGLGAVLYFCLTARPPFVADSTAALLHQVTHADPVAPRLLQPGVPRDLETICLKCLNKSPAARYASATALREDLERFLRHEPIAARPLGSWGKALRWTRRHPNRAAGLALATTLVLLLAVGGPLVALRLAHDRRVAEQAAAESLAINEFLQSDLLGQASSISLFLPDLKMLTALDRAAPGIDRRFADQPAIRAALHERIGSAYLSLGSYQSARTQLAAAFRLRQQLAGPDDPATLRVRLKLASVYGWTGNFPLLERSVRSTWEKQKRLLGPEHPDTLLSQQQLGTALRYLGRYGEAEPVIVAAMPAARRVFGAESWEAQSLATDLAQLSTEQGKHAQAAALCQSTLEVFQRQFGPDNLGTLRTKNTLAIAYTRMGRLDEAAKVGREVCASFQRVFGPDNPQTLNAMNNLGTTLIYLGESEEARTLFEKLLAARLRVSGADDPETLIVMINLASALRNLRRYAEAEDVTQRAIAGMARVNGPEHPYTITFRFILASIYKYGDRPQEAEPIVRAVLAGRQKMLGPTHSETVLAESELGDILLRQDRFAEAEAPLRHALELAAKISWDEWKKGVTQSRLGDALLRQGKLTEAEPLLLEGEKRLAENRARIPVHIRFEVARGRERLARLYTALGKNAEADQWRVAAAPEK